MFTFGGGISADRLKGSKRDTALSTYLSDPHQPREPVPALAILLPWKKTRPMPKFSLTHVMMLEAWSDGRLLLLLLEQTGLAVSYLSIYAFKTCWMMLIISAV